MDDIVLSTYVKQAYITPENQSFWFGYYNYSPENANGDKLLAHHVEFDGRSITQEDRAQIGWIDLNSGAWNPIDLTSAFNWQQGAMLQWLGESDCFIYNNTNNGEFISKEYNISTGEQYVHPWPVYGVLINPKISLTLQFKRSYWCRAYHYETIKDKAWDGPLCQNDGIFLLNLDSNEVKRIISIEDIIRIDPDDSFKTAKHWVEHIMINPSGTRFAFYHRFTHSAGFTTRVFTANIDGTDLRIISGWREYSWSHMGWIDNQKFAIYGIKKNSTVQAYRKLTEEHGMWGQILRKIYKKTLSKLITKQVRKRTQIPGSYQICDSIEGKITEEIPRGLFNLDGHPSFTKNGRYMLTDTYEDEESYRRLYIYDLLTKKQIELAKFYSPFNSCDYRSDLHPRFNYTENRVIVDSAHSGYHRIVGLDVDWDRIKYDLEET